MPHVPTHGTQPCHRRRCRCNAAAMPLQTCRQLRRPIADHCCAHAQARSGCRYARPATATIGACTPPPYHLVAVMPAKRTAHTRGRTLLLRPCRCHRLTCARTCCRRLRRAEGLARLRLGQQYILCGVHLLLSACSRCMWLLLLLPPPPLAATAAASRCLPTPACALAMHFTACVCIARVASRSAARVGGSEWIVRSHHGIERRRVVVALSAARARTR